MTARTPAHRLRPARKVGPVLKALDAFYGTPRKHRDDPLAVLVRGVLSQNTSDVNSGRAYGDLMDRFGGWPGVAAAKPRQIARAIRSGGLADQKARTIRDVMRWVAEQADGYSLDFLNDVASPEAERRLTALKGVGIKTARLVLLFGFDRPVFVVDTHVHRVSGRLGLITGKCGRDKAHVLLDEMIPDGAKYTGHMLMIQHGRRTCRARRPLCDECPVRKWCVYVRARPPGDGRKDAS